ncbi:MAG: HAD-IA family hydrolase [Burkholderiaceae bacterium]
MSSSSRPRRFDLIAFDWDGTLFDSTGLITRCIQEAVREVGGAVPTHAQASYVIGLGLMQALAHAAPDVPKDKYPALGEAYKRHYVARQNEISLFEGSLPMLQSMRTRGHLLAVATGKSRRGLDEVLARRVDGTVLSHLFEASRTADQTASKPDPLMLHELMAELGVAPERTLMIGDTTHDLFMAANADVASVGVSFGAHDPVAFADYAPLHVAHSMTDLQAWLLANA